MDAPTTIPQRRKRWKSRAAYALAGLVILLLVLPFALGPVLRKFVRATLEERLGARVELRKVSFSWPARLSIHGLELFEPTGEPLGLVDEAQAKVALLPLLHGGVHADVDVLGPELHVRRDPDGRWNWQRVLEHAAGAEESEPEEEQGPAAAPDVKARVALQDGQVVVHGPGGETRLEGIDFRLSIDGLESPAPFELRLGLRGPHGPAGHVGLDGSFTAATEGELAPSGFQGKAHLELTDLQLGGLAPALALVAPVDGLEGNCSGTAQLSLGRGFQIEGSSAIAARDLVFHGPREGAEPTRLEEVVLTGQAALGADGAGTQHLELRADQILSLVYDGHSRLGAEGSGAVDGSLVLTGDLAGLTEAARPWMPIQEGVRVSGRLEQRLELQGEFRESRPSSFDLRATGGVADLAAVDARGRALDLAALQHASLELHATGDAERGALLLERASVDAGPVRLSGRISAEGVAWAGSGAGPLHLSDGLFELHADLEQLRGTLAQLVELDPRSFGGKLDARATVGGEPSALAFDTRIEGRDLALAGTSLASLNGAARGTWQEGGAVEATGTLELGALALAPAASGESGESAEPMRIAGATARIDGRRDAAGASTFSAEVRMADDLVLALQGTGDAESVRSTLRMDARLGPLGQIVRPLTPAAAGIEGTLHGEGELTAAIVSGAPARLGARMQIAASELARRGADGKPAALGLLGSPRLALEAELDRPSGTLALQAFSIEVGEKGALLTSRASGRVLGLNGPPADADLEGGRFELEADLGRLGPELGRLLGQETAPIGGGALRASFDVASKGGRVDARGDVSAPEVTVTRAAGPLAVRDLEVALDLTLDRKAGDLEVRTARVKSRSAELEASARLEQVLEPAKAHGKLALDFGADLAALLADLGLEPADGARKTQGRLAGRFEIEGDQGTFDLAGSTGIEGFRLELAAPAPADPKAKPAPPVVVQDEIKVELGAKVALGARRIQLERAAIESGLVRGGMRGAILLPESADTREVTFEGCAGELAYVPGKLGVVLASILPGRWEGDQEERATFTLDGKVDPTDPQALIASARGRVDLGIGRFVRPEIALSGKVSLDDQQGTATIRGDLEANGGTLEIDGLVDLAPGARAVDGDAPARTRLTVKGKDVQANSGLAPFLTLIHPAFATAKLTKGELAGTIGLTLDLTYDAPLSLDTLKGGWQALPKQPIDGTGRFEIAGASLSGSPLLKLLKDFGFDAERALDLRPIEFTIHDGRVSYAKPWTWTISGSETTFTGSIGLDESLDLSWNVPINDTLVERWGFLDALRGETLSLPLRGSARSPRLDTDDLIKDMAAKAAKAQLGGRLGLGGGGSGTKDDPGSLLSRADDLWDSGKKTEAAALYKRLRDDFKVSVVYALNKDRIKERSKYEEKPK